MRPIVVTVGPLATANINAIALPQTPAAAGPLILNGSTVVNGVAVLDKPRQILITDSGTETGKTFTITGTDWAGSTISEVVPAPSISTATSVLSYATVRSIIVSAAAANQVTVGTNGVAQSPWIRLDEWATPNLTLQAVATGTVNYTVIQTQDDPNSPTNPVLPQFVTWQNYVDTNLVGQTATAQGQYNFVPTFIAVLLNSGTGSVTLTATQSGVVPY